MIKTLKPNYISDLRKKLSFTQKEFALKLNINRTQLAMAESSKRPLPHAAESLVTALQIRVQAATESGGLNKTPAYIKKIAHETGEVWLKQIRDYRIQLKMLRHRLNKMKRISEPAILALQLVENLKDTIDKNKKDEARFLKFIQHRPVTAKLKRNNPVSQALLEARIKILEAKIIVGKNLIMELKK
jgi:transcriptional regulator with XRE-family HTH domain